MIIRTALVVGAFAIGITAAVAQQDPIAARKELMRANAIQYYNVLNRMVRGQLAYDQAKVDATYAVMTDFGQKFGGLFPPDSRPKAKAKDYDASTRIWNNKADFDAKLANYAKAVADTRGKVRNLASLRASLPDVDKACSACHELYRVKNN